MATSDPNEPNPYQAPEAHPGAIPDPGSGGFNPEIEKKFRQQIVAVGGFWIIIGTLSAILTLVIALGIAEIPGLEFEGDTNAPMMAFLIFSGFAGVTWIVLGVLTCLRKMWAVYAGLILSYVSLLMQFLNLNVCAIVLLIIVILQAHRVIGWANQLRAGNVPIR
ncbi:hypothetical protein BH23PLA1_BH23PLA1_35820 [soil metagenome]